jgi:hypothetical protein
MEIVVEILKYSLPSIFLLLLCYMMLSNFMENEEKRRSYFLKKETQKSALPIRLQAYERVSMFLERITPERLLLRVSSKGLSVQQYRRLLVDSIKLEFEHNLSQQIYMSEEAWKLIVRSKSATVGIINNVAEELDPKADGVQLSKTLLNRTMEMESYPTRKALGFLKAEVRRDF